jgi:hypothetical protein
MNAALVLRIVLLGSLVAIVACGQTSDPELAEELKRASATDGLALTMIAGRTVVIVPFGAPPVEFLGEVNVPGAISAAFGGRGQAVAWSTFSVFEGASLTVRKTTGEPITEHKLPFPTAIGFIAGRIHEASGRVLYYAQVPSTRSAGLHWANFEFTQGGFIDAGENPFGDWSPDGEQVTYEKNGQIFVFDLKSRQKTMIVPGRGPSWSPDGGSISYRDSNGAPRKVSVKGTPEAWAFDDKRAVVSSVRWSPDGKYVSFSESIENPIPIVGDRYRLIVARVRDGKLFVASTFGANRESGENQEYNWILGYKDFCKPCTPLSGR